MATMFAPTVGWSGEMVRGRPAGEGRSQEMTDTVGMLYFTAVAAPDARKHPGGHIGENDGEYQE
jgi:hypothetical protein